MSGLVTYITLLSHSIGPGVIMCQSCPNVSLYFVSAINTCIFILLNIAWMIIAFASYGTPKKYTHIAWIIMSHLGASYAVCISIRHIISYYILSDSTITNFAIFFTDSIQ